MKLNSWLILMAPFCWSAAQAADLCKVSENLTCEGSYEKLGTLENGIGVTNYTYIFGEAQRAAMRVIFEDKDGYIGMYATSSPGTAIEGNCVIFGQETPRWGDRICVKGGSLPKQVWIGGEVYDFFR